MVENKPFFKNYFNVANQIPPTATEFSRLPTRSPTDSFDNNDSQKRPGSAASRAGKVCCQFLLRETHTFQTQTAIMKSSLEVNDFGSYHADGGIKVMGIVIRKEGEGEVK